MDIVNVDGSSSASTETEVLCLKGDRQLCHNRGACDEDNGRCVCEEGFTGRLCEQVVLTGALTSRCAKNCSEHGYCQFGQCICDVGFSGELCEEKIDLPCPNNCTSIHNGACQNGICYCAPNFLGLDCSERVDCPVDCGSNGVCVGGKCVCLNGYTGLACKYPADIKDPNSFSFRQQVKAKQPAAAFVSSSSSSTSSTTAAGSNGYSMTVSPVVVGIASFVFGVLMALLALYVYQHYTENKRKQQMLKPLLATAK